MSLGVRASKRRSRSFLRFKPKHEIIRMQRVGWAQIGSHWIFMRPDEVITPAGMPQASNTSYVLDAAATRHGLHVAGTTAEWAAEIAAPLEGNSNVALSFATFFAAPLLEFCQRAGRRQSPLRAVDDRQDDGLRRRSVDLRLAARDRR